MVPPTLNPTDNSTRAVGPPTYGELLVGASQALATATATGIGPFDDPQQAADTVADYLRFLAVSGRHLTLLFAGPLAHVPTRNRQRAGEAVSPGVRAIATRLAALPAVRTGSTRWTRCADQLGAAHDVLATHVGLSGELRTPQAADVTHPAVRLAAADRVLGLTRAPLAVAPDLLAAVATSQPRTDPVLSPKAITRVRRTSTHLRGLLAALPITAAAPYDVLVPLDQLSPAQPRIAEHAGPATVDTGMQALGLLRLLSYRQSLGEEHANPHTLHDLCELAMTACTTAEQQLPHAPTPLDRVSRAVVIARLRAAAAAWRQADRQLYPRLKSVVRAPRLYRDAITVLGTDCTSSIAVTQAVLATLPRLATDAAHTLLSHPDRTALVVARRDPGQLSARWRPLDPATTAALAAVLVEAGHETRLASTTLTRHLDVPIGLRRAPGAARQVTGAIDGPHRRVRPTLEATR